MPSPVSLTAAVTAIGPSASPTTSVSTVSATCPASVNLIALPSRFSRIWRSLVTSPTTMRGVPGRMSPTSSSPFSVALAAISSSAASTHSWRSNVAASRSIRPASIFEKSRMSLMIVSSDSPLARMICV